MTLERFQTPKTDSVLVMEPDLRRTVTIILEKSGLSPEDAAIGADVLVMSDLRGVESHGVSNTLRSYVKDFRTGKLNPAPGWSIERESPVVTVIDAQKRLGIIVAHKAMELAIEKAGRVGVGVVTIHSGGHLGAIGHFAMMAAQRDMVGVCFGCSGMPVPSVAPTFSSRPLFGTNPISIAAPAEKEPPFLFDAATSVISGNKIRLAIRLGERLLPGWVCDEEGRPLSEETPVFDRNQFPLLPLGGTRENGSHKGYGLLMMTEVLSTFLSGALPIMLDSAGGAKGHFAAYNISAFTELGEFKEHMDRTLRHLRTSKPVPGESHVLYPGLLEYEEMKKRRMNGIPLHREVLEWFNSITRELNLPPLEIKNPLSNAK